MGKHSLGKKKKARIIAGIMIFLIVFLFYKLDRDLKPVMMALSDAEARIVATEKINETIRDEFGNKISYDDLMTVKTDKEGNVVMIQANTVELNRIGSQITLAVQSRINDIGSRSVKLPLGLLFKNDLFAFYGPKIPFKMRPVGSVNTSYRSEFQAAGINQTRHIVYLDVISNVQVIIPLAQNMISVSSSIPIAESIIIGKVPEFYANLENIPEGSNLTNYGIPKK